MREHVAQLFGTGGAATWFGTHEQEEWRYGHESAAAKRARFGYRPLTDEERAEQLRQNLDDVCPTASTKVRP